MILLLLLQTVATPAQPPRPPATMVVEPVATLLASFDRDLDGRTTRDEVIQGTLKTFTAIEPRPATPLGYIGYSDWRSAGWVTPMRCQARTNSTATTIRK